MPEFFKKWLDELDAGQTDAMLQWFDVATDEQIHEAIFKALWNNPT